MERFGGRFHRTIQLQTEMDRDRISAEYRNGILTIVAPKAETARARRIPIATD
jgi:HSP20 family protein